MSDEAWFSAKLRWICFIEPQGATRYMDSVFVVLATDFHTAFEKALSIGRSREQTYTNTDGQRVA